MKLTKARKAETPGEPGGQIEMVKKQFEEENNQLNRQLEENKVSNANKVFKSFTKITLHFVDENESEFPRKVGCQKTKKS